MIEAINFYLVGGAPFKISDKGKRGKNVPRVVEGVAEEFEIVREQVGEDQQVGPGRRVLRTRTTGRRGLVAGPHLPLAQH